MNCRFCNNDKLQIFIDLGQMPPSNSFIIPENINSEEEKFPLKVYVCPECLLVQAEEHKKNTEIFNENYAYFSSVSESWLNHARNYTEKVIKNYSLNSNSFVIEIASNDGYLLQFFKQKNIKCLGIEPAENTAKLAREKGIETITDFFGENIAKKLAETGKTADLIIGNNVLAHTPYLHDFVQGVKIALKPEGICTFEFPHILNLISENQFDTIYHEHFSYFSLYTVEKIFKYHKLNIFDAEEINTHGGSLRIYAEHLKPKNSPKSEQYNSILEKEKKHKLHQISGYSDFEKKARKIKAEFLNFLNEIKSKGKKIAAYGAAAKGNTFLNYSEINSGKMDFVVDKSSYKRGKFLPGSKIPVVNENVLKTEKPDYILILPWNLKNEITEQLKYTRNWNAKFVTAIPELKIF